MESVPASPAIPSAAVSPLAPLVAEEGKISVADPKGYSATIDYSVEVSSFAKSVTDDAPGFASVVFALDESASVTNTTASRNNPGSFYLSPILLYSIDSDVCVITKDLVEESDPATFGLAVLPRFTTGDSPTFCALPLSGLRKYGPGMSEGKPLAPGEVAPMTKPPTAPTYKSVISSIPESNVPALIAGLALPVKVVFEMTLPAYGSQGFTAEGLTPTGEHCNSYFIRSPKNPAMKTNPLGIFVPPTHAGVCPA